MKTLKYVLIANTIVIAMNVIGAEYAINAGFLMAIANLFALNLVADKNTA